MGEVMETSRSRTLLAALAVIPALSFANDHQICYQHPPQQGSTALSAQFLCRTDGTSAPGCQVTGVTGSATFFHIPQGSSDAAEVTFSAPGTYVGTIQFADGKSRTCTVEIPANATLKPTSGNQNPGLLAFTTDASGLVTTGVWTSQSFASPDLQQITVTPPDFVAVGGGFTGATAPTPVLMKFNSAYLQYGPHQWISAGGSSPAGAQAAVTGFAIGLKIEGLSLAQLTPMIVATAGNPSYPPSTHPSMTQTISVTYPQASAAIGGGGYVGSTGQYLTVSEPQVSQQCFADSTCEELVSGWKVSSNSTALPLRPGSPTPMGEVYTQLIALPKILTIGGLTFHVETWVLSANSAPAPQASTSVTLPLDYALTSIGATATSSSLVPAGGNFIWSLVPAQGGASAASIMLAPVSRPPFARPGVISAYAVGMKLVAGPIPPLKPRNLNPIPGTGKSVKKPPPKTQ
jgi:hypothetical protein